MNRCRPYSAIHSHQIAHFPMRDRHSRVRVYRHSSMVLITFSESYLMTSIFLRPFSFLIMKGGNSGGFGTRDMFIPLFMWIVGSLPGVKSMRLREIRRTSRRSAKEWCITTQCFFRSQLTRSSVGNRASDQSLVKLPPLIRLIIFLQNTKQRNSNGIMSSIIEQGHMKGLL